jgi:hypothetical protein
MKKLPWVDRAKDVSGPLSGDEIHFLQDLKGFIDYGLRKGVPLRALMSVVVHDIDELARDRFDFQKACKKRGFHPKTSGFTEKQAEMPAPWLAQAKGSGNPLSKDEVAFLEDFKGFIDYGIRNEIPLLPLMAGIGHDVHELQRDDFDFQAAVKKRGFCPMVTGYSRVTPESWDISEDQGEA